MDWAVVVPAVELSVGIGVIMVFDVRRIRLRTRVLAIADPASELYRRNLPVRAKGLGVDNAALDRWSARIVGPGWFSRAACCLAAGALMAAGLIALRGIDHHSSPTGAFIPVLIIVAGVMPCRRLEKKMKSDLVTAEYLADEMRLRKQFRDAASRPTAATERLLK